MRPVHVHPRTWYVLRNSRAVESGTCPSKTTARDAEWTTETAEAIAASLGVRLTPLHWKVLGCVREECLRTRRFPLPCAIARLSGLSRSDLERLFPGPAFEALARISGCLGLTGCWRAR